MVLYLAAGLGAADLAAVIARVQGEIVRAPRSLAQRVDSLEILIEHADDA